MEKHKEHIKDFIDNVDGENFDKAEEDLEKTIGKLVSKRAATKGKQFINNQR